MTDSTARVYAIAIALVVFFVAWAAISARPFASAAGKDERIVALERREQELKRESVRVKRVVERRFADYGDKLRQRQKAIAKVRSANRRAIAAAAATPSVSTVSVPSVTSTGSS
ncbi:MAG: hypothetical protein QOJ13_1043 [Gaiellales bacterium]|jgi:uncharacterized protein (DUF3084 family)|nr:hypothetical protein [Gaiellales bacterium]